MLKNKIYFTILFVLVPLAFFCQRAEDMAVALQVSFEWNPPCTNLLKSPEITIESVPEGTVQFYVGLTDLDLPSFDHGGGFIPYRSENVIPAGAVEGYQGPSPPYGVIHSYEIMVEALGPSKEVLGVGRAKKRFPPEGEEEKRWSPCG